MKAFTLKWWLYMMQYSHSLAFECLELYKFARKNSHEKETKKYEAQYQHYFELSDWIRHRIDNKYGEKE